MRSLAVRALLATVLTLPLMAQTSPSDDASSLFDDPAPASTTEPPPGTAVETPADPSVLAWKVKSGFRLGVGVDPGHTALDNEAKAPGFDQDAQLSFTNKDLKVVLHGIETWGPSADGVAATFRPQENHLIWSPGDLKFDAGWQIFSWGSADGINPTDVLNPRDYAAGVDSKKIPVFALASTWYPSDGFSVELVYIPITPPDTYQSDPATSVPTSLFSGTVTTQALATDLSASTVGGRVRGTWGNTTAALSFVSGFDDFLTPVVQVASDGSIGAINLVRERQYKAGVDVKTIVDRYGFWLETGGLWTQGATFTSWDQRHPTLSWVAGMDFNFGEADRNYVNLQYFGQWIPGYDDRFGSDYPGGNPTASTLSDPAALLAYYQRALVNGFGGQTEGLTQGISLDLKVPTPDDVVTVDFKSLWSLPLFYDTSSETRYGSVVLTPEVQVRPFDSFTIALGTNLAYSWVVPAGGNLTLDRSESIGGYTQDNVVTLAVTYQWAGEVRR